MSIGGVLRYALGQIRGGRMLKVGDEAPDFEVTDHRGGRVKLSDLRGSRVILWFYPKADTPG